eukprot:gene362-420_t
MTTVKKELFEIEYAKSDRSTCKKCGSGIHKGEMRVGHSTPSKHHDGLEVAWFHVKCKITIVKQLDLLRHWEMLQWDDQVSIRQKYFPKDTSVTIDAATEAKREKYINALWEIKNDLESDVKGPAIKSIVEFNKGRIERVPPEALLHQLADWMLLGRTGPCPTCKNLAVTYNSVEYKCYGYATEFTKCDWTGPSIDRYRVSFPGDLKKPIKDFFAAFKYTKSYPKNVYNYDAANDEEDEEEEEEEEEDEKMSEPSMSLSMSGSLGTQTTDSEGNANGEEDPVPKGQECFGMVIVVAGTSKNLSMSPTDIKDLVAGHGAEVTDNVAKATLMISCEDEVTKDRPTKKITDAINSIPIFTVEWIQDLCNRTDKGIELRKRDVSKSMVIAPSEYADDHEIAEKYIAPKTTTTTTTSNKKRRAEQEGPVVIVPKKSPKAGSDILKADPAVKYGYNVHVDHDTVYGYTAYNVMLNLVDIQSGANKFYKIQLLRNNSKYLVFLSWGRIGNTIGSKQEEHNSLKSGVNHFAERFQYFTGVKWDDRHTFKKLPGKYYMVSLDDGWEDDETTETVLNTFKKTKSEELSTSIVAHASIPQRTSELVKLMFDPEMMKKQLEAMNIDVKKMPLGKIKKSQIMEGYAVLSDIQNHLAKEKPSQAQLIDCANRFYTLIPHNFGSADPPIINTTEALKAKMDLIEALIDIDIANTLKKESENHTGNIIENHYRSLKTTFEPMDKTSEDYKLLVTYAQNSHDTSMFRFGLSVEDIFTVAREGEHERFKPWEQNDNKLLLWHGSRLTNWVGIISQGLRIAPPSAPTTGYRFGKGIYFADCISKSASYCFTTKDSPTALMILCEVSLGKMNELKKDQYMEKAPAGTHSTKALGNAAPDQKENKKIHTDITIPMGKMKPTGLKTACTHNEFIVYDIAQVRIRYILKVHVQN